MTAPALTAYTDENPWVEVFLDTGDVAVGTVTLRYYRNAQGRTWLVRGGVDIAPGTAALDFECPFGVVAAYRAEQFDAAGASLGYTAVSTITLNVEGTWVHNPLDPTAGVQVEIDDVSAKDLVRPTPGELVFVQGSGVPRRIGSRRRGLDGVDLSLSVQGVAVADAFQDLLGSYDEERLGVLCLRTSEPVRWPKTFMFAAPRMSENDVDVRYGGDWVQFVATVDEVAPPFPGLSTPLLSYDDLDVAFATYTARDAAYASYTVQDRDYSKAGLAATGGP